MTTRDVGEHRPCDPCTVNLPQTQGQKALHQIKSKWFSWGNISLVLHKINSWRSFDVCNVSCPIVLFAISDLSTPSKIFCLSSSSKIIPKATQHIFQSERTAHNLKDLPNKKGMSFCNSRKTRLISLQSSVSWVGNDRTNVCTLRMRYCNN